MDTAINGLAKKIVNGLPENWVDDVIDGQLLVSLSLTEGTIHDLIEEVSRIDDPRCRLCGCTDYEACPGGCSWVEDDLCSACVETERLLDASPDMLRALERIASWNDIDQPPSHIEEARGIARVAIAKAKGEKNEQEDHD